MPIFSQYDKRRSEILMYNVILLYETNFQTKWNIAFIFRFFFKFGFHLHVLTCVSLVIINNNISCQQYAYASVPISEQELLNWFSKLKMWRKNAFPILWRNVYKKIWLWNIDNTESFIRQPTAGLKIIVLYKDIHFSLVHTSF